MLNTPYSENDSSEEHWRLGKDGFGVSQVGGAMGLPQTHSLHE